jgi:NAD(P)-dependent dehydrogenase (short-subunit alcohol dehydrogenase family)
MDLGLKGRVAAIMGGSAGIGKAAAAGLAAEGANLVLMARDEDNLKGAAKEITDQWPVEVLIQAADATDSQAVNAAAAAAAERFGTVNILINSAGHRMRRLDRQILWEDEDWLSDVDVKTIGMLRTIRAFLPHLATDGSGRVINIGGLAGWVVWESAMTHGLNNAAMQHVGHYLAADLAEAKITVNTVVPGFVGVEWRRELAKMIADKSSVSVDEYLDGYVKGKGILAGRWAEPEEVADLTVFLASERAAYINGASIVIDGGMSVNLR